MTASLKRESVTFDNSYIMHSLWVYIQSLTTASGSRLFGIGCLTRWPGFKSHQVMGFFQPDLVCFVLCNGFRVVGGICDLDLLS